MRPVVRLLGPSGGEIVDLESWFRYAPPEKGLAQWTDGYSAKEQAKAWVRAGRPAVPDEFGAALGVAAGEVDELIGTPEQETRLDRFKRARQHDLLLCGRRAGVTRIVAGVEAKACENFDGIVGDRASAAPPSNKRARCNLLARALFGRDVFDEVGGAVRDLELATHGYQLWTAAVGTIIEAQRHRLAEATLVVHQFRPRDLVAAREAGDRRDWAEALRRNERALDVFVARFVEAGGHSSATEFVEAGTKLNVVKVQSVTRA